MIKTREIQIGPDLKKRLVDLGWELRSNMSALVVDEIRGLVDGTKPFPTVDPDEKASDKIRFSLDDETWDAIKEIAADAHMHVSPVVRGLIVAKLEAHQ
jgi:hypothetical protein